MASVQELLSQINAGQAKRTAAPDKKRPKLLAKKAAAAAAAAAKTSPSASAAPSSAAGASSSQGISSGLPPPTASTSAPAPAPAAKDASKPSDFKLRLLKGGYHGNSPLKPGAAPAGAEPQRQPAATASAAPTGLRGLRPSPPKAKAAAAPLGKRQKDVQDYLRANVGDTFSAAEVLAATGFDVAEDTELLQRLRNPPAGSRACVVIEDDPVDSSALRLRYRPRYEGVRDKVTLLNFIREHQSGIYREDVDDSYKGVVEDMQALFAEQRIFMIHNPETEQMALFPAELEGVSVDEDIVTQFHEVELPYDVLELQAAVQKAGLRSALASQELKRALPVDPRARKDGKRQRPRRERAVNINKVTNAHLPSLFVGSAPKNIDER